VPPGAQIIIFPIPSARRLTVVFAGVDCSKNFKAKEFERFTVNFSRAFLIFNRDMLLLFSSYYFFM